MNPTVQRLPLRLENVLLLHCMFFSFLSFLRSSVKPIQLGEELCFDYSCVSESNKEFQKAICLCGSPQCRGSFVSYADGKSFNQVISLAYHFLRRTRVLYEASTLPLTSDDILKLNQVGIRVFISLSFVSTSHRSWQDVLPGLSNMSL